MKRCVCVDLDLATWTWTWTWTHGLHKFQTSSSVFHMAHDTLLSEVDLFSILFFIHSSEESCYE